jgi:RNA recognition motif-containing protein
MNIYISNLSFSVEDNDLQKLFGGYGEVTSARVVTDRYTGQSRGFGFVEMSDADAVNAINGLNQSEHDGKVINVAEARPKEERPRNNNNNRNNFRRDNGGGYNRNNNSKRW